MSAMKIKKGDTVKVIAGKDNGKEGKVLAVNAKDNTVVVENINKMCIRDRVKVSRVRSRDMVSQEDLWLTVPNITVMQVPMVLVLIRARYSKENTCQVIWEMFRLLYRTLRLYA